MRTCSKAVRPSWRPPDPLGGVWSASPATGELRPEVGVHNLYTVHLTLTRWVEDCDELAAVIARCLTRFHLMITNDGRRRTQLTLTVETSDLWQAVLLTLNAVTSTGHMPVAMTAEPTAEAEDKANSGTDH
jgi:hypothetical protein